MTPTAPAHVLHALTVRRLKVDLSKGFARHWHGGNAFKTAFFNALSMSFPAGEQFFIDAVRRGCQHLPDSPDNAVLQEMVRGFIGQEATHRHLHGLFNAQLEQHGLLNIWAPKIAHRRAHGQAKLFNHPEVGHLYELAVTCAYEHFTAIFGHLALSRIDQPGDFLSSMDEPLQTLWRWHACEEIEHKSVAFELYTRLGGTYGMRKLMFVMVLRDFTVDITRQILSNLWRDRTLHRPSTWWQALCFLLGRRGLFWLSLLPVLSYCRRSFHPERHGNPQAARDWLQSHAEKWTAVGGALPADNNSGAA